MPRLHARAARARPARGGARGRARASRSSASASACRCCSSTARRATRRGSALLPGRCVRFRARRHGRSADGSRFKVPHMGWNQVHQARPHPLWDGIADAQPLLFRAQLLRRSPPTPRYSAGEARLRRAALPARWRGITFSPRSSIPKRAQPPACASTATSSTGSPEPRADSASALRTAMLLIPAIDLKDGHCVRLKQGDMDDGHRVLRRPGRDGAALARRRARGACTSST